MIATAVSKEVPSSDDFVPGYQASAVSGALQALEGS
jgi:hypothetical protein